MGRITGAIDVATGHLTGQRSPEVPVASEVLGTTRTAVVDLADALQAQGDACADYATQVDQTRQTIRDLLKDLAIECGVTAGISLAAGLLTFGGAAVIGQA